MKKFLLSLALAAVGFIGANAQFPYGPYLYVLGNPDTLKINQTSGNVLQFFSFDIKDIDFSDPKKVVVNTKNDGAGSYYRNSISDMRFYNRYSNPNTLLTTPQFGAYEGLFYADNCRSLDPYYLIVSLASDEMLGGGAIQDGFASFDYLTFGPYYNTEYQNRVYQTVYKINDLIRKAEELPSSVDPKVAAHTKGEILFLRAYHYYELATLYRNIQYITDNNSWEQRVKTFSPAEIWGNIMLDLKSAINLMDGSLCPSLKEDGRVSRYAAEALLARAYLFYTGFYLGKHDISDQQASVGLPDGSTLTKQNVVDYLSDCIDNSPFHLVNDYRNIWPYTNRYTVEANPETAGQGLKWVEDDGDINPEVLFKIRYNINANWNGYGPAYANTYALTFGHRAVYEYEYPDVFPIGSGWGAGPVAPNLWDDWAKAEPKDLRRAASIQDIKDTQHYNYNHYSDDIQLTQYHEKKISPILGKRESPYSYDSSEYEVFEVWMFHPYEQTMLGNNMQGGSIHPLNLIRFSDVLLMHSELTGTTTGLNRVRERAGLDPVSTYSLEAIQQERRWELAFEGVRWNDMRRWGDDYCKQALDRQLNQPIINMNEHTLNDGSLFGYTNYSEQYEQTQGFFDRGSRTECAKAYEALAGQWTYGDLNGVTYGTMKYKCTTAEAFLENQESLISGYSLDQMKTVVDAADGEVAEYARMSIEGDNIYKITADGDTIARGRVSLSETDDYDWRICTATISDGAVLGSNGCSKFDIISLDDKLVLVDATSAATDGEAQFWVFRQTSNRDNIMYNIANKKWSYGVLNGFDYNTYQYCLVGPWGIGDYLSSGVSVPGIYCKQMDGVLPDGLAAKAASWGISDTRDADLYAYMQFNLTDKTVSKYTRDGQLIATGAFECEDDGNGVKLTVHNNATLFPYAFYGEGDTIEQFYLRYSEYSESVGGWGNDLLVMQEITSESQFTFWTFCQRGIAPEELDEQVVINQYDKNNNPTADGCYFTVSFKDGRQDRVFGFECVDGTAIKTIEGLSKIVADNGSVITKEMRIWVLNCNNDTVSVTRNVTFNMDMKPAQEVVIWEGEATAGPYDAAPLRFSDNEGKYFPYLSDDIYWGQIGNDLHFTIKEAAEGTTMRVMDGWWSSIYYDDLPVATGDDFHFTLTEKIAQDCSRGNGGGGRDLNLLVKTGQVTISKVFYYKE